MERKFSQPEFAETIDAAKTAISGKDRQAAYEAAETLFDALKADKHIDRLYKRFGIDTETGSDVTGLAGALTGKGGFNMEKSDILEALRENNIPIPPNARKRKARRVSP